MHVDFAYDARGNVRSYTDERRNTHTYEYDAMNRMTVATDPNGNAETITYNPSGKVTSVTDKLGRTRSVRYDELGRPVMATDPLGNSKTYEYDEVDNLITTVNERGYATRYEYDVVNRVTRVTTPSSVEGEERVTTYEYGPLGRISAVTDPLGIATSYEYDVLGRTVAIIEPAGAVTQIAYDKNGNRNKVTDAESRTSFYTYDARDRLVTEKNPAGETVMYEYDGNGNLVKRTNANGAAYEFTYDLLNRQTYERDSTGIVKSYSYDGKGNIVRAEDAKRAIIRYSYDKLDRMVTKQTPEGTTNFTYNAVGNMLTAIDADSSLEYAYDALDRLEHSYDREKGIQTDYTYDSSGNILIEASSFNSGAPRITTSTYGPDNSLASLIDPDEFAVTYGYDMAGRLSSETKSNDTRTDYTYTATSLVETIKHTNMATGEVQKAFAYLYDKTGKRTYQAEETGDVTAYEYDPAGRLAKTDYPFANGQALTAFEERLNAGYYYANRQANADEYTFNVTDPAFGQLDTQKMKDILVSRNDIMRNAFGIQSQDQVKWQIDPGDGALPFAPTVQIDSVPATKLSQILASVGIVNPLQSGRQVWREQFEYDDNGNRDASANGWGRIDYAYDERDRLLTVGSRGYAHDANGNITSEAVAGATVTYTYDSENRFVDSYADLSGVIGMYPHGRRGGSLYTYDPLGRESSRVDYTLQDMVKMPVGGSERHSAYNGTEMDVALELTGEGAYQPYAEYTYAGSSLVSRKDLVTGDRRFYAQDVLGSTVAMTNGTGDVLAKYDYSAFGTPRGTAFLGMEERLFTGKPFDYSAGTYNFGFRSYDPVAARFTTLDPIKDGLNWYAYCAGDPINSVDLWGLCEKKPFQIPYASKWGHPTITGPVEAAQNIGAFVGNVFIDIGNGGIGLANGILGAAQNPNWSRDILNSVPGAQQDVINGFSDAGNYLSNTPPEQIAKDLGQTAMQVISNPDTWEKGFAGGLTMAVVGAPSLRAGTGLGVATVEAVGNGVTKVAPTLEGEVAANFKRFASKVPANAKASVAAELLEDGNYLFSATSPGKVPGSSALYQKWVNPNGETINMLKTTVLPDGSIAHVKSKM